jgi:hypothetical protein
MPRTIVIASRTAASGRSACRPMRSVAEAMPDPSPKRARPCASSSSAPISIAMSVGCRLCGLNTPMPMPTRLVAAAQADAAGSTPRSKGFSANQTQWKPLASATRASSRQRRGSMPP